MERLDEFPKVLAREDPMPWDETGLPETWPFGASAGTPLRDFSSMSLIRKRAIVEAKNGAGSYFKPLLDAIEIILREREGL